MNAGTAEGTDPPIAEIGCPVCDAVFLLPEAMALKATRCTRCHYRLTLGKSEAVTRVVATSLALVVLTGMVMFLPFLDLRAGQFRNSASVFDTVLGFSEGIMLPLALAVFAFILVLPMTRFLLFVYALGPMTLGIRNLPAAFEALRWAIRLKPWAMAEIFMVGVSVALVKLAGMATISLGLAFWIFAVVVVLSAVQDTFMCRNTLWTALERNR